MSVYVLHSESITMVRALCQLIKQPQLLQNTAFFDW